MSPKYSAEVDDALEQLRREAWEGERPGSRPEPRQRFDPSVRRREPASIFEAPQRRPVRPSYFRTHSSGILLGGAFLLSVIALGLAFLR